MKVVGVKVGEPEHDRHDVRLDNVPTSLEEFAGEPIRVGCFVGGHGHDSRLNLLLREAIIEPLEVVGGKV